MDLLHSTVEEDRGTAPQPRGILAASALHGVATQEPTDPQAWGSALWSAAIAVRGDDRPLYWARLAIARRLRADGADAVGLDAFERASRGLVDDVPADIVVTGFDPFVLDDEPRRGNPSGAIALALHRTVIEGRRVRAMIFPVRYRDFDAGLVERALTPYVGAAQWIVTVSQGRPDVWDLEVWNGRRRSNERPDNLDQAGGGTALAPIVAPGMPAGPEFIAATLPFTLMTEAEIGAYPVRVNHSVRQLLPGATDWVDADEPAADAIAVEGSGGGYLSNEIAYRNTRLLAESGTATLGGHVHTPVLPVPPGSALTDTAMEQAREDMIEQFRALLTAGLLD